MPVVPRQKHIPSFSLIRPASGPEERKLGQRKLALDLTPYKEIYNQKTHCLCGAFRKQFLA